MEAIILALLIFTNAERVNPLTLDQDLSNRAAVRAEFLCHNTFSHDGWTDSFKGIGGYIGENLAKDFSTPKRASKALVASPTHYANIVSEKYKRVGFAYTECEDGSNIYVEFFAS